MSQAARPLLDLARRLSSMFPDNVEIWSDEQIMDQIVQYFDNHVRNFTRDEIGACYTPERKSHYDARMRREFYERMKHVAAQESAERLNPKP